MATLGILLRGSKAQHKLVVSHADDFAYLWKKDDGHDIVQDNIEGLFEGYWQ